MSTDFTVHVVDDDPAVRQSLRALLRSTGRQFAGHASAEEFLLSYHPEQPGCVVLDVRMPGMSGIELQLELAARGISIPVIFVTAYADVPMAVRALKGGAIDFLQKPFSRQALIECLDRACEADRQARAVAAECVGIEERLARLTPREREVMRHLVDGHSNRTIATDLTLSVRTVEAHRAEVLRKVGVRSAAGLVRVVLLSQRATEAAAGGRR
jgi:FixJ family two-component response regulator